MATSETEIVNAALIAVSEDRIASLDDPGEAARAAKVQYPITRDALLESYNWTFAIARQILTPDGTTPAFGFSNRFLLPADCLRFLGLATSETVNTSSELEYSASSISHKIEGRYLLFDDTEADIFYIKKVTTVTEFSALFVKALSLALAVDLVYTLTGGARHAAALEKRMADTIKTARFAQAIQGQPQVLRATEWLDARDQNGRAFGNPWAFGASGF